MVAMAGVVLVHLAGRMTTGVLSDDAVHVAVLTATLALLAGMGLMGRNDLGLRIPSALEALLGLLVVDKILSLLLGGQVPIPFATNPFASSLTSWGAPLFGVELALLGMVFLFDWVEGERLRRGLEDHRTAFGRSLWVLGTTVLSLGAASLMALLFGLRRSLGWQQPAVALAVVLSVPFMMQSWTAWALSPLSPPLTPVSITTVVGVSSLVWTAVVVLRGRGLWLSSALWATHAMMLSAAVMSQSLVMLSLAALTVSAAAWLSGIMTRRKSWRIVGAGDLVVAWMVAAVALVAGTSAVYALMMLVASAVLLFAVTTLTQANEDALLDD